MKFGFLVVGHTHEDIDQMFSCVARRLIKHDALTLKELKKEIAESYTPEIDVKEVDCMFDVKTWMEPVQQEISGHIYHHQFKIERNGEGRARLYYKKWSTSKEWLPNGGIQITNGIPVGEPVILQPNIGNLNLGKIKADLNKFRLKFDHSASKWWSDFIENQETRHDEAEWLLQKLVPQNEEDSCPRPQPNSGIDQELRKLLEKEEKEVEVKYIALIKILVITITCRVSL